MTWKPDPKEYPNAARAERVIAFAERYLRVPEGALVGQPIRLADFQKRFIYDVYARGETTRRAYMSIARKNAKSATIACILLAHIIGPEAVQNSQIVSGAMSRDQAALIFNLACKMIAMNDDLAPLVKIIPSGKRIVGLTRNVEYKALSAEAKTTHGLSPVVAILDEIGQVVGPHSDFIDAITTAQGAYDNPLLIAISTQAATDADLFSIWLDDAQNSKDPHIVSHVYQAPADCELSDRSAWAAANPALGLFRSEKDVEEQAKQAQRMPSAENSFRNLILNQRVSTFAPFVSRSVWESNGGRPAPMIGVTVSCGLDLSMRTDLTAFVVTYDDGEHRHVVPYFWTPEKGLADRARRDKVDYPTWVKQGLLRTTPGATVDYAFVAHEIAEILSECEVTAIAYDRWRIDLLKRELEAIGLELPLKEFGQGFKDMSPALDMLEADLLNHRLRHGMHPVLTMCAANAVTVKDPAGNRKLDKSKATGRIDGMVALAMAVGVSGGEAEQDISSFLDEPLIC